MQKCNSAKVQNCTVGCGDRFLAVADDGLDFYGSSPSIHVAVNERGRVVDAGFFGIDRGLIAGAAAMEGEDAAPLVMRDDSGVAIPYAIFG